MNTDFGQVDAAHAEPFQYFRPHARSVETALHSVLIIDALAVENEDFMQLYCILVRRWLPGYSCAILRPCYLHAKAREKLYRLLDEAARDQEPVLITGPRSNAVLVGEFYIFFPWACVNP